jgi:hypothetical protein
MPRVCLFVHVCVFALTLKITDVPCVRVEGVTVFSPSPSIRDIPCVCVFVCVCDFALTLNQRYALCVCVEGVYVEGVCVEGVCVEGVSVFSSSPSIRDMPCVCVFALTLNQTYALCVEPIGSKNFWTRTRLIKICWTRTRSGPGRLSVFVGPHPYPVKCLKF